MERITGFNQYQELALKTDKKEPDFGKKLDACALGLGEVGEVQNLIKKVVHHEHPLDDATKAKIFDELGDVMWYIAVMSHHLGASFEKIASLNVEKLSRRFPGGFTTLASIAREEVLVSNDWVLVWKGQNGLPERFMEHFGDHLPNWMGRSSTHVESSPEGLEWTGEHPFNNTILVRVFEEGDGPHGGTSSAGSIHVRNR
jgi:NTP pyrophosphatase (non-canonical NTP hydrolase)